MSGWTGTPWAALAVWVLMVGLCGVLLLIRISSKPYRDVRLMRLAMGGIAGVFALILARMLDVTGDMTVTSGIALMLGLIWVSIWWIYRRIFHQAPFAGQPLRPSST